MLYAISATSHARPVVSMGRAMISDGRLTLARGRMVSLALFAPIALLVHEAGHAVVAIMLRLPWRPVLTRRGPGIAIGRAEIDLARWQVRTTATGGPLFNIVLALVCIQFGLAALASMNILFAIANLVPLPHSDGARMLRPGRAIARAKAAQGAR